MKATESKLLGFLKKSPQFSVPIYQRMYRWELDDCAQLLDDILRAGRNERVNSHFLGSIVYIQDDIYTVSSLTPLLVIDGQQRLATVTLLLEAIARFLGDDERIEGFNAKKIRNYYLLNDLEKGEKRFKLLLTQTDKASLLALVQQNQFPAQHSVQIEENFNFFINEIEKMNGDLSILCKGLEKLMIVDIALSRGQDDPQLIFESMNSTGRELSQADLIRNFILMGLMPEQQTKLYERHWRPMEEAFGQEGYRDYFDPFMRHFLTIRTGEIPKLREVYEKFKRYARDASFVDASDPTKIDQLVMELHEFANYYCAIAIGKESDAELASVFQDLREVEPDVAMPLMLTLYDDFKKGIISKDELISGARLVESYIFRRAVCEIPSNSMQKTFAQFSRKIKRENYLESVVAQFLLLPTYRRFPSDEEFHRIIKIRDLYNFRRRSYYLKKLENFDRKEKISILEFTIEHILPQNKNLSESWIEELGIQWRQIHEELLHTLGNLTLTAYNSELSDRPFAEKKSMEKGFSSSPLHLNSGLSETQKWNRDAIESRAEKLSLRAMNAWSSPSLDDAELDKYREGSMLETSYSIVDHPYISPGSAMENLFLHLKKSILELDPNISVEFLKYYVAFKAETNFVDVVPQARKLRLSLNMHFQDLSDPSGLAKDITDLGRWGNGDVEIGISVESEISYAMGLIRQSFEKQMSSQNLE